MDKELRHKDTWSGSHKGIHFEIARWSYNDSHSIKDHIEMKDVWNSYIFIAIDMFPESAIDQLWLKPDISEHGSVSYDYFGGILGEIEFHGGITYYSKLHGMDGGIKTIKVGCDYNHLWDQDMHYTVEGVRNDIKDTINSFIAQHDDLKHRCVHNGKYYDGSDGYILRDGTFYSFAGMIQQAKWQREQNAKKI